MAHTHGTSGFDAFTVADEVCDDGWAIGVEWQIDGRRYERRIPGDCEPNEPGSEHYTMTVWPKDAARVVGPGVGGLVWSDIQECTPLPDGFTEDQRESLYKQLVCHLAFARHSSLGGDTWDLESHRPNISWFRVLRGEDRCNWGGGGGSSD